MRKLHLPALLAALAWCAQSETLTLIPSNGDVSGSPGSVVGWGFTLTYSAPADWVELTGSTFTGSMVYGTYQDYLSGCSMGVCNPLNAPFYVAGPAPESSTVTAPWNPTSTPLSGLGEFDINSTAFPGATIAGDIIVVYDVFSVDPNSPGFDPITDTVATGLVLSAPAQVLVTPEPSEVFPLAVLLLALVRCRARRRIA
jgi:hypothetical protein